MFEINVTYIIIPCKQILKHPFIWFLYYISPTQHAGDKVPHYCHRYERIKLFATVQRYCMADIRTAFLNNYLAFSPFTQDYDFGEELEACRSSFGSISQNRSRWYMGKISHQNHNKRNLKLFFFLNCVKKIRPSLMRTIKGLAHPKISSSSSHPRCVRLSSLRQTESEL